MSTQPVQEIGTEDGSDGVRHRIGAVARLAGVPVTTLRVWEQRYQAFQPGKTGGRHRLYSEDDVAKARLLRQLAGSGHGIGGIAHLPLARLRELWEERASAEPPAVSESIGPRLRLALVGAAVVARFDPARWPGSNPSPEIELAGTYADLAEVAALEGDEVRANDGDEEGARGVDVMVVRLATITPETRAALSAARHRLRARATLVLHGFGTRAGVAGLRSAGFVVRREPVPDAELAELLGSLARGVGQAVVKLGAPVPPRRYSDAVLAEVAARPNSVACECPRHIADILGQLASFEEYSAQCLTGSPEDVELHGYLRSVAGAARALFEEALDQAARHGGVDLPVASGGALAPLPRSAGS